MIINENNLMTGAYVCESFDHHSVYNVPLVSVISLQPKVQKHALQLTMSHGYRDFENIWIHSKVMTTSLMQDLNTSMNTFHSSNSSQLPQNTKTKTRKVLSKYRRHRSAKRVQLSSNPPACYLWARSQILAMFLYSRIHYRPSLNLYLQI